MGSNLSKVLCICFVVCLIVTPGFAQLAGTPQAGEGFGTAVAAGDFNNDGFIDLAVGVPSDKVPGPATPAGAVNIIYGTESGLEVGNNSLWRHGENGVMGNSASGDFFGHAVATGDFNGDLYDDLAIGSPYDTVDTIYRAGSVTVLYGSSNGITDSDTQHWTEGALGFTNDRDDRFGWSVSTGDFDNDGFDDLAVGARAENLTGINQGAAIIIYGTANGLDSTDTQFWTQANAATGVPEDNDEFGFAVAVGDFDGNDFDDLAIGAPHDEVGGVEQAGSVTVIYGTGTGLSAAGSQLWGQDSQDIEGVAEPSDRLGLALAAGDFDDDGFDDLAIGTPEEKIGESFLAGSVSVIYGSAAGLSAENNHLFSEDTPGVPLDLEGSDMFGQGLASGDLDNDGYDELIVGIPRKNVDSALQAGTVLVVAGSPGGLTLDVDALVFSQGNDSVVGDPTVAEDFGAALATGDFDNDGIVDLAVGVPRDRIGSATTGSVNVLYGVNGGPDRSQLWYQGAQPVAIESEFPGVNSPGYVLSPAYPNPFTSSTTLKYELPIHGNVRISIFDALGRRVAELANGEHVAGEHELIFNALDLPSGLYMLQLTAERARLHQRLIVL